MSWLKENSSLLLGLGGLIIGILTYQRMKQPQIVQVQTPAPKNTIVKQFAPQIVGPGNETEVQLNFAERMGRLEFAGGLFNTLLQYNFAREQLAQSERQQKLDYEYQLAAQKAAADAEKQYLLAQSQNSQYQDARLFMGV